MPTYFQWGPKKKRGACKDVTKTQQDTNDKNKKGPLEMSLDILSQLLVHRTLGQVCFNLDFESMFIWYGFDMVG